MGLRVTPQEKDGHPGWTTSPVRERHTGDFERCGYLFASRIAFRSSHVWPSVIHAGAGSPFR